jgi:patatin-like phospholipase/acyl hydrolase
MASLDAPTIKVLSVDGGGIRGIVPAVILSEIQKRLTRELSQTFDLIAGTSTGGIIALGLGTLCNNGKPYTPDQLLKLYLQNGSAIFKKTWLTPVRQLLMPKYSPDGLQVTLTRFFQATEFCTAQTPLLISSYNLQRQLPFFFKSHLIATRPDYNWKVTDIARATSAAPTFFPPFHLTRGTDDYALVDGGIFVNNPSMAAYVEARLLYPEAARVVVVSVGTGDRQDAITYAQAHKWGLIGWAKQIVPVLMDSVSEAVDFELTTLPECTYYRLQVTDLPLAAGKMDNVAPDNLATLQTLTKNYLAAQAPLLAQICAELKTGRGSDMPGIGRPPAVSRSAP